VTDLRPATASDAAILALHQHRHLVTNGWTDETATRATQAFLPWARRELEAGRLIAVIAGGGLEAAGSIALHVPERPASLTLAELVLIHAPPELEPDLIHALLDEARLRGITEIVTRLTHLEPLGFRNATWLERTLD
jgi:hypothetical protein